MSAQPAAAWQMTPLGAPASRMCRVRRLLLEDVKTCATDFAVNQCLIQPRFVHQRAAGDVDETGRRLHERKTASVNDVAGFRVQVQMQREKITFSHHLVQVGGCSHQVGLDFLENLWLDGTNIDCQDAHPKGFCASR